MTLAPKRWFHWSLRTMFVVVTVLCLWMGYQLNWIRQRNHALTSGDVVVDGDPFSFFGPNREVKSPSLLWLFGERGYGRLSMPLVTPPVDEGQLELTGVDAAEAERLKRLFPESTIDYSWQLTPPPPKPAEPIGPADIESFKVL
jgi:hypothetical protein